MSVLRQPGRNMMSASKNKMSVLQLTILTAVNMMGSGIIMLPTKLAEVGDGFYSVMACDRCRLYGTGLCICQVRYVQPPQRRDGRLRGIRIR